jgi:hypothetical protein
LIERHILERAADRRIDPLPRSADLAEPLDAALACGPAALGDRDRTFEDVENLRRRDFFGLAREPVAALRTAPRRTLPNAPGSAAPPSARC